MQNEFSSSKYRVYTRKNAILKTYDLVALLQLKENFMRYLSRNSLFIALCLFATHAFAQKQPAPGPEFGEGSIGLLALGISAVAYAAYRFKNKK
ncbi:MAG TPA: hypothetical protein PLH13_08015 [Burkholderiaceae bacterium]|nr:hypothetical protein [Burkholderiaceae bacterium]